MHTESFIPKILDFDPAYDLSGDIARLLKTIAKAEKTLQSQKQIHHFLRNSWSDDRLEIVLAACRIQTWSLKQTDIIACLHQELPKGVPKDKVSKIRNYANILDRLNNQAPSRTFSLNDLKEIHMALRIAIDGKENRRSTGGQLRQGVFAVSKMMNNEEKIKYIPPAGKSLFTHLEAYFDWLSYARKVEVNPFIVAAVSHHHIMELRPFNADNGKVARLFMRKLLLSKDYPWRRVLPYERIYAEDRDLYYQMIDDYEVSDRNFDRRVKPRFNQWILYNLVGISDFYQELIDKYIRLEQYLPPPPPASLNDRQKKALNYVKRYGAIATKIYVEKYHVGRYQAFMDLQDMVKKGKLLRIGDKGRSVVYILSP